MVHIIDQSRLPHVFETATIASAEAMAEAIRAMRVRGAPLIGVAAAYGIALAVSRDPSDESISKASAMLRTTRPTAVNLAWAIGRMREQPGDGAESPSACAAAWSEAQAIADEDVALNEAIGTHGLALLEREHAARKRTINILTHCNAGWIATVDWGTVTAPIFMAHDARHPDPRLGRRDAPAQPGPPHRVGARGPRRAAHARHGQRRRPPHAARHGGSRARRRGPRDAPWRRLQQDRHVPEGRGGARQRHSRSTPRCPRPPSTGPSRTRSEKSPSRSAPATRCASCAASTRRARLRR